MTRKTLTHAIAWATAKEIVHVFAGCLRGEEVGDALDRNLRSGQKEFGAFSNSGKPDGTKDAAGSQ